MAVTVKSVGHFFARVWTAVKNEEPKIEAGLAKVEGTEATVETVTAAAAPAFVAPEKLGFAVLGELSSILSAGDAAAKAKLADAGMDVNVITQVETLLKAYPQVVTAAKAL